MSGRWKSSRGRVADRAVVESNCIRESGGGEQLETNSAVRTIRNSIRPDVGASLRAKERSLLLAKRHERTR